MVKTKEGRRWRIVTGVLSGLLQEFCQEWRLASVGRRGALRRSGWCLQDYSQHVCSKDWLAHCILKIKIFFTKKQDVELFFIDIYIYIYIFLNFIKR